MGLNLIITYKILKSFLKGWKIASSVITRNASSFYPQQKDCNDFLANSSEKRCEPLRGGSRCGWESQRFVTLKNRARDAAVGGHPVKRGGRCCSRGTCCVGGGRCGWEPPQVVTLKNRKMWGEARFGGTYGVEVGLPARGTCVF